MVHLRLERLIAAPATLCFELSLSVDAHTGSMAASGERAVAGVTHGSDQVTWRARHFGVPWRMTSVISEYDAPRRFVDEQVRGPFAAWRHEHVFVEESPGSTLMTDLVDFEAPAGPIGRLATRAFLAAYLRRLLETRNGWLQRRLES